MSRRSASPTCWKDCGWTGHWILTATARWPAAPSAGRISPLSFPSISGRVRAQRNPDIFLLPRAALSQRTRTLAGKLVNGRAKRDHDEDGRRPYCPESMDARLQAGSSGYGIIFPGPLLRHHALSPGGSALDLRSGQSGCRAPEGLTSSRKCLSLLPRTVVGRSPDLGDALDALGLL